MKHLHFNLKKNPHVRENPGQTFMNQMNYFSLGKRCFWLNLIGLFLLALQSTLPATASDVVEVIPLTNQIIIVHFDDGYVDYHDLGERREDDVLYHIPLNVALADQLSSYSIRSADDPAYASGVVPDDLSRKSKGTAYLWLCESYQNGVGCTNTSDDHAKEHWVYLFLPEPMQSGKTYTVDLGSLAKNGSSFSLTYDDNSSRTEAVHVNNVGYDPAGNAKYGYVYHWMGTKGGLDLLSYAGASFQLINQVTGNADFSGTLTFRKAADNQESPYTNQTPDGNFLGAEVYECNFSGFGGTGTYVLSVDGIGCSFPFELNSNVYDEVFYWTMKGLYQNRSGIALEAPYTAQPRPAPHNPNITPGFSGQLKYTSFRYPDATKSDNDKNDKPLWEAGIKGDINTWGWYQDAGDWDAYSTHARVPANLLFLYEAAPQNFNDGQLNIPESGNGLPDLLDEARWLIRFYHRTRQAILDAGYGTGGVGGARVFGDLWGGDELADGTTIGSWQDTERLYVVSGEDPFMTYTYAGLAAQYAWILEQGGFTDPEGINWQQEAQEAWTWAKNNTLPGDETPRFSGDLDLINHRMYAATALYRLTGNAEYHTQFIADVSSKAWTTTTVLDKDNRYPAWIYSLMDNRSKDTGTAALALGAVQYTADFNMLYHVDKRACRWAGNYFFPMLVGQGTTPMVNDGVMGYVIAGKVGADAGKLSAYKLFMQTTCDYFLGTNPLNMTWLTGVGDRSPGEIFHLDSWYSGQETPRKGIIPYGPWHDELSLGPVGPWNHKWATKTLTPNNVKQWPGHERWYDLRSSPFTSEFTVHQNNGVAAMVYGFLKNGPGTYRGGDNNSPVVATPSALTATASAGNQINLSWEDNSSDETGFRIERKSGSEAYGQIATVAANATVYSDNGLAPAIAYTYRVRAYSAGGNSTYSNEATATTLPEEPAPGVFQQNSDGLVVMEAEHYSSKAAGTGSFSGLSWTAFSDGGASEGEYMVVDATGNNAWSALTGPRLNFEINFTKTGQHYLWARIIAPTPSDDSFIPALNGNRLGDWYTGTNSSWGWKKYTIGNIAIGEQTFSLFMREDGTKVDKLLITDNSSFSPSGIGPAETLGALAMQARQASDPVGATFSNQLPGLEVYPNPLTANELTVRLGTTTTGDLEVRDMMGRLLLGRHFDQERRVSIPKQALTNGVLILTVRTLQGTTQAKLLVQ